MKGEGSSCLEAGDVDALDQIAFCGSARMHEIAEGLRVTVQGERPTSYTWRTLRQHLAQNTVS